MFGFYRKKSLLEVQKRDYVRKYRLVACDITSNCNLRCKFCFNHFDQKNVNMTAEVLDQMLKVLPYVSDTSYDNNSGFYFSCLGEPSIHPNFIERLEQIQALGKEKIFFTTNFAKAQDDVFFERLRKCNIHHMNVSIETLSKDRYQNITKGTEMFFENFFANLTKLATSFEKEQNAPKIRYISMAIQSNYDELVDIVLACHEKYHAYISEVRTPFVGKCLAQVKGELLSREQIDALAQKLDALDVKVSHYLEYQDDATIEAHNHKEKYQLSLEVQYQQMPEDYYDLRIYSDGKVKWNANQKEAEYKEDCAYDRLFENELLQLARKEANENLLGVDTLVEALKDAKIVRKNAHLHIDQVCFDDNLWEIQGWTGYDHANSAHMTPVFVVQTKNASDMVAYVGKKAVREDVAGVFGEKYRQCGFSVLVDEEKAHLIRSRKCYMYLYDEETKRFAYKINYCFKVKNRETVSWQI